jgi:proprotein convertase subtilisin/kexin type 5
LNSNSIYCSLKCPIGYYYQSKNNTCLSCKTNCIICSSQNTCSLCIFGTYLNNNLCLNSCPSLTYSLGSYCMPCDSNCKNCSHTNGSCFKCITNTFTLSQGKCISSCFLQQYLDNGICYSCSTSCLICNNQTDCISCQINTYLYNGTCISNCPESTYANNKLC